MPSMKESHTTEKQREQIYDNLSTVLNKNKATPQEVINATKPYVGVLYEFATSDDVETKLLSQYGVNILTSTLFKKEEEMKSMHIVDNEVWLNDIFTDLFEIDNLWKTEVIDGVYVFSHYRLHDWKEDSCQYFVVSVICPPEGEPMVAIDFPLEAMGAPTAFFTDNVDGEEDLDNDEQYNLPTGDWTDAAQEHRRLTKAYGGFLDLMLNKEFMYLCYRTKDHDNIEMVKVPLGTFQIAYRDAMARQNY